MKSASLKSCLCVVVVVVVFLEMSIAMSQSVLSPHGQNLIQQVCLHNTYPTLCLSTLKSNPKSLTANLQGLAAISLDITSKKVAETLALIVSALGKVKDRGDYERYGTCVEEYGAAKTRLLPAASADLRVAKYFAAVNEMKNVAMKPQNCEAQFGGKSAFAVRNKAVHDLAVMTADVIKVLATAN